MRQNSECHVAHYQTYAAHYLTQSDKDKQMTQHNLPIIRITPFIIIIIIIIICLFVSNIVNDNFLLVMLGNLYCITILHNVCTIWGIVCCQLDSWDRVFNPVFTQGPSSVNTVQLIYVVLGTYLVSDIWYIVKYVRRHLLYSTSVGGKVQDIVYRQCVDLIMKKYLLKLSIVCPLFNKE